MNKKFRFVTTTILGSVVEDYIRFVGDNYGIDREKFLEKFRAKLNSQIKTNKEHAELMKYEPNHIIIQTSRFISVESEYINHYLWVFTNKSGKKYDWELTRFRIV